MATKVANSQAKAQAKATPKAVQIVGSNLVLTIPLEWNGKDYANEKFKDQPDSEKSKRVACIQEKINFEGQVYTLGCNLNLPADVKVTQKQRLKKELEEAKAELEELRALKRMA
tara:strand:- start:689 stop:1030 length:342 start_codon:yes stop_codon:yes gene_type:complete